MTKLLKPALAVGLAFAALSAPAAIAPVAAQSAQTVGVVNYQAVIASSNAFRTAQQQRQTTYQAQIDQANQRRTAIQQQLQPLVTQLQTASQQPNADQAALQQQAVQIQQIEQAGQRELQQILAPVQLSQAYAEEQVQAQLPAAIENAAKARGVTLVLTPDTVLYAEAALNLNQAVLEQLNTLLPSIQVTPPEGWLPAELREQQAAQAAAQGQAPAATTTPVEGR
jgi:Skp family chaperone for outer membrane proteins